MLMFMLFVKPFLLNVFDCLAFYLDFIATLLNQEVIIHNASKLCCMGSHNFIFQIPTLCLNTSGKWKEQDYSSKFMSLK